MVSGVSSDTQFWLDTAHAPCQVRVMEIPLTATWNVFPFATLTGAPVKSPHQVRTAALSVMSSDWIDHADPLEFVQDRTVVFGRVIELVGEVMAVWDSVNACPPAVYPVPVSSVPAAVAVDAVEFSRTFIAADVENPRAWVPAAPAVAPVGAVALITAARSADAIPEAIWAISSYETVTLPTETVTMSPSTFV